MAEDALGALLSDAVDPLLRGVLRNRLGGSANAQDYEDVAGEVILELMVRLRKNRQQEDSAIENFPAYVRAAARHGCDAFFRRRHPQRHRLKNRIRYVLREDPHFAVWLDINGGAACGRTAWQGRPAGEIGSPGVTIAATVPLESALETIFDAVGAPVELDELVGFLAAAWGIRDEQKPIDAIGGQTGVTIDLAAALDNRRRLERLWTGIAALPAAQRTALLLHLRDDSGGPVLALLPASGAPGLRPVLPKSWSCPYPNLRSCGTGCRCRIRRLRRGWASPASR